MADFINTINELNDDAVMDSILDGSITEFRDNTITTIKASFWNCRKLVTVELPMLTIVTSNLFRECVALENVYLPAVTSIYSVSFLLATGLKKTDLPRVRNIEGFSFPYCYQLVALILRANSVCTLGGSDAFASTPIAGYTTFSGAMGYIYVPSALVNSYKSATNWSTYASQFRALEDYTVDGTTTGELDPNKI